MPLSQNDICDLLQTPHQADNGLTQQTIYGIYSQQQISVEGRVLLADWIAANAEVWYRISNEILPSEATAFIMSAVEFLEHKLQNSDNDLYKDKRLINSHISYLRDVCAGKPVLLANSSAPVILAPAAYLLKLRHCLLEETAYFEKFCGVDDIDGAVTNYVQCSVLLGKNLDNFVKILERCWGSAAMNNPGQQQSLWTERQVQQDRIIISIKSYIEAQKRVEMALLNYRARFNRQMARESFAERPTLHLDQLQPAYDTAAQIAMRDLARLQMCIIFARHVNDEDMALNLQAIYSDIFTFLCNSLVTQCLVLEKQMPQIVRKGAKFATTPQLRMLCPSVMFPNQPGQAQTFGQQMSRGPLEGVVTATGGQSSPVLSNKPFLVAGGFAITQQQHPLSLDTMVEQRVASIQQQQQQVPNRMGGSGRASKASSSGAAVGIGTIVTTNVDIEVYFLSESQARDFVQNLALPKHSSGAMIHSSQMTYDKTTKQSGAAFKALSLSNFSRGDRKHSQLVTEEKFCLAFTCLIPLRGLIQLADAQQATTVLASVLSLPIVVTVHNSQEANAAIATLWDNYFAETNRLPFEVTRKATWADVKQLLNGKWKSVCGKGLSEENLAYLADRLLHNGSNKRASTMVMGGPIGSVSSSSGVNHSSLSVLPSSHCYDNETVTWTMLAKDLLPCYNAELPRFTFWDWFHSCLKLMSKDCLHSFWPDHLIGFASHEQVEEMLRDCDVGTFLLRFSSTELGAVVIPYVKRAKSGARILERGYGPCTFKECEPGKVISDLKPLKFFYPSRREKHSVLQAIDEKNNKTPSNRKKKNTNVNGGYEKLEQKTVGASSSSDETDEGGTDDESMNCDVISNTPQSVSPLPLSMGGHNEDSVSQHLMAYRQYQMPDQQNNFFNAAFSSGNATAFFGSQQQQQHSVAAYANGGPSSVSSNQQQQSGVLPYSNQNGGNFPGVY